MKHGDKVHYHRRHHVKKKATWLCWITRGDRRLAMVKIEGDHRHIEVAPSDVEIIGNVHENPELLEAQHE